MKEKYISIITDRGGQYGSGHLQRMLLLCEYLNRDTAYTASLVCRQEISMGLTGFIQVVRRIEPGSVLILRDMRDSDKETVAGLRKICPVVVIDDVGEGRYHADYIMDLLPNLLHARDSSCYYPGCFLYGYNFYKSLQAGRGPVKERDYDVAVYCGDDRSSRQVEEALSSLSGKYRVALFKKSGFYCLFNGKSEVIENLSYSELLCSSKILITYFGLTLFDGLACGCHLLTVNPGKYHADLCNLVTGNRVENLGIYSAVTAGLLDSSIEKALRLVNRPADMTAVQKTVVQNLGAFTERIGTYIN